MISAIIAILTACSGRNVSMETEVSSEVSSENVVTSSELTSENASDDAEAVRDVFAMDTYMTVKAYGSNGDAAVDAAVDEINRLDALLSTGKKDSEIGQINANNGGQLSEDGAVLMERSLELYKSTNGAFDVAIYPVMKAWGFTDGNYQVPDADNLLRQIEWFDKAGFDGIKMLDGKPGVRRRQNLPLDAPNYDKMFDYAQRTQFPILYHICLLYTSDAADDQ